MQHLFCKDKIDKHNHLSLTGNSASLAHFQAYLVEGIVRWNEDRANATALESRPFLSYSYQLRKGVNDLYKKVYGEVLDETVRPPRPYTGHSKKNTFFFLVFSYNVLYYD